MLRLKLSTAFMVSLGLVGFAATPARAVEISKIYVGTFSNPVNADPSLIQRGSKYVVKTTFDTADLTSVLASTRPSHTKDIQVVQLTDAPGTGNTYELFVPTQGYGTLTQTGQDHFVIGPGFAPTAEIQFFTGCNSEASCDAAFRGFEFESNYLRTNSPTTPHASGNDLIFEQFTPDANFSGTVVTNYGVNVLDAGFGVVTANSGHVDVLSESSSASGGQLNPGVFFAEAVEVVAEAGPTPLVYSAAQLTVTTNAGTEQVTEAAAPIVPGQLRAGPSAIDQQPRQADNDLGAGRTDGEDFLTYDWTVNGGAVAGNLDGTRLNRVVETLSVGDPSTQQHGSRFVNNGTRTVSGVNIAVAIQNSGLQHTTDTTTFQLQVQEGITGLSDTDSVSVTYQNTGPTANAGPPLVFDAGNLTRLADGSVVDPDLAVNALIPGFESIAAEWTRGATSLGTTEDVLVGIVASGLTSTTDTKVLDFTTTDLAGASSSASTNASYLNAAPTIGSASATAQGTDLLFALAFGDADLAVNALIAGFEVLSVGITVDATDVTGFFGDLINLGSQLVDELTLAATFGYGLHGFNVMVTDLAGAPISASFQFEVLQGSGGGGGQVPTPATLFLLLAGGASLVGLRRRGRTGVTRATED